jgi:Holliday junction resolvase RusA-like endonuclease
MTNPYLTTKDVADIMRLAPESIRRLVWQNKLHPVKVGNTYIYDADEISQYLMMLELKGEK